MARMARSLLNNFRDLFTANAGDEAWIDNDTHLTPREALVRRVANILEWGAGIHFVAAGVLIVILFLSSDLANSIKNILLLNNSILAADVALLAILLALFSSGGLLLLLAVGALAQEFWALPLLVILVLVNLGGLLLAGFTPALLAIIVCGYAGYVALQDWRAFHGNPVAIKELRGRMRGVRAFAIITVFLSMMGSFTVLLYLLQLPAVFGGKTIITGELGRTLFTGVFLVELLMIIFIVPALTAGAVTGERERGTYDLLQTTLLSAPAFLVGKMESALGYILLLLLSGVPLQSIAFLFGGISEIEVILAFVILTVTALLLGAMGLFFSAFTGRTLTATVRVYTLAIGTTALLTLKTLTFSPFLNVIQNVAVGAASPLIEILLIYTDMLISSLNPVTAAYFTQQILITHQQVAVLNVQLQTTGGTIPVISPWILLTIFSLTGMAALLLLAVRRMRRAGV
jgi:hypothetical protein